MHDGNDACTHTFLPLPSRPTITACRRSHVSTVHSCIAIARTVTGSVGRSSGYMCAGCREVQTRRGPSCASRRAHCSLLASSSSATRRPSASTAGAPASPSSKQGGALGCRGARDASVSITRRAGVRGGGQTHCVSLPVKRPSTAPCDDDQAQRSQSARMQAVACRREVTGRSHSRWCRQRLGEGTRGGLQQGQALVWQRGRHCGRMRSGAQRRHRLGVPR